MPEPKRQVTEADFRHVEFREAKVDDYEFRDDGRLVRKDRWEKCVRSIATMFGVDAREGFECDLLEFSVEEMIRLAGEKGIEPHYFDEYPQ